jgi:hypothetical protein
MVMWWSRFRSVAFPDLTRRIRGRASPRQARNTETPVLRRLIGAFDLTSRRPSTTLRAQAAKALHVRRRDVLAAFPAEGSAASWWSISARKMPGLRCGGFESTSKTSAPLAIRSASHRSGRGSGMSEQAVGGRSGRRNRLRRGEAGAALVGHVPAFSGLGQIRRWSQVMTPREVLSTIDSRYLERRSPARPIAAAIPTP